MKRINPKFLTVKNNFNILHCHFDFYILIYFMQLKISSDKVGNNVQYLMRKIGYLPLRDPRSRELGYVRRLGAGFYPRFHAHPSLDQNGNLIIDLHFENYKPMHLRGTTRSEREGQVLEEEAERIQRLLSY